MSHIVCDSEQTRNFKKCPENDEENHVTHPKLSHGVVLVHSEALFNYSEKQDESTPA